MRCNICHFFGGHSPHSTSGGPVFLLFSHGSNVLTNEWYPFIITTVWVFFFFSVGSYYLGIFIWLLWIYLQYSSDETDPVMSEKCVEWSPSHCINLTLHGNLLLCNAALFCGRHISIHLYSWSVVRGVIYYGGLGYTELYTFLIICFLLYMVFFHFNHYVSCLFGCVLIA